MHTSFNAATTALLLCGLQLTTPVAMAAACDGSSAPCTIDLGRASATFALGADSYYAEAVLVNGQDVSVNANPYLLSVAQVTHAANSDSLIIQPQIYANVGGSGFQGLHEAAANLQFTGLSFAADPGYYVVSVQAIVRGSFALVGNGYGGIAAPGIVQWDTPPSFIATTLIDPAAADTSVGFTVAASYLEGEDGTAASFGTANASIDSLEFVVTVSPVPESSTAALLLMGAAMLPWFARQAGRQSAVRQASDDLRGHSATASGAAP